MPQPSPDTVKCALCTWPSGRTDQCKCESDCGDEMCAQAPLPQAFEFPPAPSFLWAQK